VIQESCSHLTDPGCTGRGLGELLHDAGQEALRAAGCRCATFWVTVTNAHARSFYERKGSMPKGSPTVQAVAGVEVVSQCYERSLE
jgi:ribosomal protein S18 acetylase RimI-like enzyme